MTLTVVIIHSIIPDISPAGEPKSTEEFRLNPGDAVTVD